MIGGSKDPTLNSTRTKLTLKRIGQSQDSCLKFRVDFPLLRKIADKTIYRIGKISSRKSSREKEKKIKEEKKYNYRDK